MKGNLYQHIKIWHAYDFSLCFPHELLMSFWMLLTQFPNFPVCKQYQLNLHKVTFQNEIILLLTLDITKKLSVYSSFKDAMNKFMHELNI